DAVKGVARARAWAKAERAGVTCGTRGIGLPELLPDFKLSGPDRFYIGDGDSHPESHELGKMYSFCLGQRRIPPKIGLEADSNSIAGSTDPFSFVAEHVNLMKR
ncbi:unnamed protein product, partial [Polarella glacialis]